LPGPSKVAGAGCGHISPTGLPTASLRCGHSNPGEGCHVDAGDSGPYPEDEAAEETERRQLHEPERERSPAERQAPPAIAAAEIASSMIIKPPSPRPRAAGPHRLRATAKSASNSSSPKRPQRPTSPASSRNSTSATASRLASTPTSPESSRPAQAEDAHQSPKARDSNLINLTAEDLDCKTMPITNKRGQQSREGRPKTQAVPSSAASSVACAQFLQASSSQDLSRTSAR
jgi:hypothetical protein